MDPAKEGEAARALFDQGVDIITQHTDSTEPLKIAEERGMLGFGQAHDMFDAAPKAQLTAIVDNWGPYYIARVQAVMDGTWESQDRAGTGFKEGTVQMSDYTNMPDEVAEAAREIEAKITTGEFHPFTGPIYKQDGTSVAAEGEVMDDVSLLTWTTTCRASTARRGSSRRVATAGACRTGTRPFSRSGGAIGCHPSSSTG
jgi:basic membrane protein A and related proteins